MRWGTGPTECWDAPGVETAGRAFPGALLVSAAWGRVSSPGRSPLPYPHSNFRNRLRLSNALLLTPGTLAGELRKSPLEMAVSSGGEKSPVPNNILAKFKVCLLCLQCPLEASRSPSCTGIPPSLELQSLPPHSPWSVLLSSRAPFPTNGFAGCGPPLPQLLTPKGRRRIEPRPLPWVGVARGLHKAAGRG